MYDGDYYWLMAQYNQWMNDKIYSLCDTITDTERKKDRGAFFKSIHGTLNHLLYGDRAWMERFTGNPTANARIGQTLYDEFVELRAAREKMDEWILEWSLHLDVTWLKSALIYKSNVDGKTRRLPAWVLVTQMFNHQTHHRGQVTTLIKQYGIDPGITDIPWLPALDDLAE